MATANSTPHTPHYMLKTVILTILALTVLTAFVFETGVATEGPMAGMHHPSEFALLMTMELLTIAIIPTALKLFRFKTVQTQLRQQHGEALKKWGTTRLLMLGLPMLLNTLLYYIYLNTSFGFMAIILALCLPFVWPSEQRCANDAFISH